MEMLALRNVSFQYPNAERPALRDIDLTLSRGDFFVVCGPSGSGKSTLLRQVKSALTPAGTQGGAVLFSGRPLADVDLREQSAAIGFVGQSPEEQLVTDKVWHELAFGPESLGLPPEVIRRRVAEMAGYFGIQDWMDRSTAELSGGQQQLVNLAAVMVLSPALLVLDEPTAQLDPPAASEFLSLLGRLNRELGTTVLLSEHRLEEAFPLATGAAVLDGGRLLCQGTPAAVCQALKAAGHPMFEAMPASVRVWASVKDAGAPPVTVRDGRAWMAAYAAGHPLCPLPPAAEHVHGDVTVQAKELWFRYEKNGPAVVKGLSLTARRGELLAILGGNGTGKTTALRLLAGRLRPERGRVTVTGRAALLPQSPKALFTRSAVGEELRQVCADDGAIARVVKLCRLEGLLERHPYDLSGGEQQRAALAKVLLTRPEVLLLDEPTKGLDPAFREGLGELLERLCRQGLTVVLVSHDVEFCARWAHRCALMFDGSLTVSDTPRAFFPGNRFYTTAANRMAREQVPEAVTTEDLIAVCGGTLPERKPPAPPETSGELPERDISQPSVKKKFPLGWMLWVLLVIPLTLWAGTHLSVGRKDLVIALAVLAEAMVPFFVRLEGGGKSSARDLAVTAALCAVAVAGRAALFMLPQCKPILAVVILTGAALGRETGFLVGALSMLVSNMLFGQGSWTPWQMFAAGMIGWLSGLLFYDRKERQTRLALCLFGAAVSVVLYGAVMNASSALLWADPLTWPVLLSYFAVGLPMDCVQGAATAVFLWCAAKPVLKTLERIRIKYGLTQ